MKNVLLLTLLFALFLTTPVFSQALMDFVSATIGDTLVVKTQDEMLGEPNALYQAINLDTVNVPAGRVYKLKANGTYNCQNNPTGYVGRTTVVVGSNATPLVANHDPNQTPPLMCGNVTGTSTNTFGISSNGDLTVKNCAIECGAPNGNSGWAVSGSSHSGERTEFDNCLFERTLWTTIVGNQRGCKFFMRDCYFVNLCGHTCRRNGGCYDGWDTMDTILVENCTHVNTQGSLWKWRDHREDNLIINHNTFVNCSGIVMLDLGSQAYASYTNNMLVNANVQPFPGIASIDNGEIDKDMQPTGFVNLYPDTAVTNHGYVQKFLVEANNLYWSPYLANCADTCNTLQVDGKTGWADQHILMNTRTKAMFNNTATYPYLTEGKNYNLDPGFTNTSTLFSSALVELKRFSVTTVDTACLTPLNEWRVVNTGSANFIYFDWPIPINLSYTNATLLTGSTDGLPVGDLNWFPTQKATWLGKKAAEYAKIKSALDNGIPILAVNEQKNQLPGEYTLSQNYPNPFNPSTKINFTLAKSGNTTLKIIDMLGRELATLVNGFTAAGSHDVEFNAAKLSSGTYFYQLTSGNFTEVKKMMLVK
jgi:hypothetical protein